MLLLLQREHPVRDVADEITAGLKRPPSGGLAEDRRADTLN
jgi:hypothetical protein